MPYLPHTDLEERDMLHSLGIASLEDLFQDVPSHVRYPDLELPAALSEMELHPHIAALAARNTDVKAHDCFLGAGAYHHFIPATVNEVLRRGEFYTAYTPYQPEASQGMLQAMFEYQSMICALTAMDVANASHYDGATALAEAVRLALNVPPRERAKVVLAGAINPHYRNVVETYLAGTGDNVVCEPSTRLALDAETAAVVVQNPNYLGQFERGAELAAVAHEAGALLIVVADPIALGLFEAPGSYGADIVVADGQPLGIPLNFGGPYLGIFATRQEFVRRIPGRLVGETIDAEGRRGYVLTLATREQHIRRALATSNICTNAGLMALAATTYLATMGEQGLRQVAELCFHKSHYAAERIGALAGCSVNPQAPEAPFFKEFVVALPRPVAEVNPRLLADFGIIGGYDLGRDDPAFGNHMLVSVTEMCPREAIDRLVRGIAQAIA